MLGAYTYNKVIRKCVIAFGTLFNNIEVRKETGTGSTYQKMKVPLAYGPRQKFLARLEQQPELNRKVAITLPRISFEMTGLTYDGTRKLSPINVDYKKDGSNAIRKMFTPVPYNLDFSLSILSKTNDEALEIVEQIAPVFQPSYNVTIKIIDDVNEYRDIPIVLNNMSYSDEYEGNFDQRKLTTIDMNFTMKAYIFGPTQTGKPIKKAKVDYKTGTDTQTAPRRVSYTVEPKALRDKDSDGAGLTLTSNITNKIGTLQVTDSSLFSIGDYIEINNEVMKVKTKPDGTSITVSRGQNATTQAAHSTGSVIDIITSADTALLDSDDDFGFNEMTSFYG
ncbi:MAG: hypothetical protein CMA77_04890 [Euryarchaeota archaeon]|nr:hypothetical protein [Euryarchaeota archaeon]|tara:strand:+ start:2115 stop:3122 length:1008 start_codon:yes stop_codon:yes gene_type:complete